MLVGALLELEKNPDPSVKKYALEGLNSIVFKNLEIVKNDIKNKRLENFAYKETAKSWLKWLTSGLSSKSVTMASPCARLLTSCSRHCTIETHKIYATLIV